MWTVIRDDLHAVILPYSNARVGGAEVDANGRTGRFLLLSHVDRPVRAGGLDPPDKKKSDASDATRHLTAGTIRDTVRSCFF